MPGAARLRPRVQAVQGSAPPGGGLAGGDTRQICKNRNDRTIPTHMVAVSSSLGYKKFTDVPGSSAKISPRVGCRRRCRRTPAGSCGRARPRARIRPAGAAQTAARASGRHGPRPGSTDSRRANCPRPPRGAPDRGSALEAESGVSALDVRERGAQKPGSPRNRQISWGGDAGPRDGEDAGYPTWTRVGWRVQGAVVASVDPGQGWGAWLCPGARTPRNRQGSRASVDPG
jgi:hypothetical protein